MAHVTAHPPGTFCWIELATSDPGAAKDFYTRLFDWSVNQTPIGEGQLYSIFQKDGADVAAMYKQDQQGVPPNWASYIAVADADAATEQAKSLGATVMMGPFDVMEHGRMSVITDPQGATFAIWQPKTNIGVGIRDEPGSLCWNELQARDLDAARKFYTAFFGWTMKVSPEYTEFSAGGPQPIGGMLTSQAPPPVPSYWLPYFAVEQCDASVEKAQSLGAAVFLPPTDIPHTGRFAVLADPQGATFAFYQKA
ncbi:MAG: VOC family protein [Acidobacteriota bacterium]